MRRGRRVTDLFIIDPDDPADTFPPVSRALTEPPGLLAVGGDLSVPRLLAGYRRGIFPWYSTDQPILWWAPDPRCILWPDDFRCSRSLAKKLRHGGFTVTCNTAFEQVMRSCGDAKLRPEGSWIHDAMVHAYIALHAQGMAHSVEIWHDDQLAGGLYGVLLGTVFFGESMFSRVTDASKVALWHLCHQVLQHPIDLIDCQMPTAHLQRLGATAISRNAFSTLLAARQGHG